MSTTNDHADEHRVPTRTGARRPTRSGSLELQAVWILGVLVVIVAFFAVAAGDRFLVGRQLLADRPERRGAGRCSGSG